MCRNQRKEHLDVGGLYRPGHVTAAEVTAGWRAQKPRSKKLTHTHTHAALSVYFQSHFGACFCSSVFPACWCGQVWRSCDVLDQVPQIFFPQTVNCQL